MGFPPQTASLPFDSDLERTVALEAHAVNQLRFIRSTMERAAIFTALPGWGGVAVGFTALIAGNLAKNRPLSQQCTIWAVEAVWASLLGGVALFHKAQTSGQSLASRPARRALFSFAVPLFAGLCLTAAVYRAGLLWLLPSVWMMLYGTAVVSAGAHSVRIVPAMGLCFTVCGALSLINPTLGNAWMTVAFGLLHIAFGWVIARRYGG